MFRYKELEVSFISQKAYKFQVQRFSLSANNLISLTQLPRVLTIAKDCPERHMLPLELVSIVLHWVLESRTTEVYVF